MAVREVRSILIFFVLVSTALSLLACCTHFWVVHKTVSSMNQGLWMYRNSDDIGYKRFEDSVYDMSHWKQACRVFMCLGAGMHIISLILCLIVALTKGLKPYFITITLLIAGICLFICMSLYTQKFEFLEYYEWGWSFAIGWASFVITLVSLCLSFTYTRLEKQEKIPYLSRQ